MYIYILGNHSPKSASPTAHIISKEPIGSMASGMKHCVKASSCTNTILKTTNLSRDQLKWR